MSDHAQANYESVEEQKIAATGRLEDDSDPLKALSSQVASDLQQIDLDELPRVVSPYLPGVTEFEQTNMYTLVLDLDETLIHYFETGGPDGSGHFLVRPGAYKFLREMS